MLRNKGRTYTCNCLTFHRLLDDVLLCFTSMKGHRFEPKMAIALSK